MGEVIGPFTLNGTSTQNSKIRGMAVKMTERFKLPDGTSRIKPVEVVFVPNNEMEWAIKPGTDPDYPNGVRARGYWKKLPHRIEMNGSINAYPVAKTFAHEGMHVLDDDWLLFSNRRDIKPLMSPVPATWKGETFAIYASAAICGFTDPPYAGFYGDRFVPVSKWPKLAEIALRDDHGPTVPELLAQIAELEAALAASEAKLDVATEALAQSEAARAELALKLAACEEECVRLQTIIDTVKEAVTP